MGFKMKSFSLIVASMVNWFASAQNSITDLNVGGVIRTMLEAVASELAEVYYRIYTAITDAQATAVYTSFDFPLKPATASAGVVLWQTNGLPASQITIPIAAQAAVPATSATPEITFSASSGTILPAQTTLNGAIVSTSSTSVTVTSAANMGVGDVVQVDTEKMRISAVVGNVLTVARGYQGSTAATHANAAPIGVVGKAVTMTADVAGAAGNVVATTINKINTLITGIVSVTNEAALSGGTDLETDDQRKKRFQDYVTGLARGTKTAIEFGAKNVQGVVAAHAIDLDDDGSIPVGQVNLYIADAAGTASGTLISAVQAEEENWKPAGVLVLVLAPSVVSVNVTATLKLAPGFNAATVVASVQQTLTDYITGLSMGQPVYLAQLYRKIVDTVPSAILNCTITTPAGDTAIANNQIARPGTFTVTAP